MPRNRKVVTDRCRISAISWHRATARPFIRQGAQLPGSPRLDFASPPVAEAVLGISPDRLRQVRGDVRGCEDALDGDSGLFRRRSGSMISVSLKRSWLAAPACRAASSGGSTRPSACEATKLAVPVLRWVFRSSVPRNRHRRGALRVAWIAEFTTSRATSRLKVAKSIKTGPMVWR